MEFSFCRSFDSRKMPPLSCGLACRLIVALAGLLCGLNPGTAFRNQNEFDAGTQSITRTRERGPSLVRFCPSGGLWSIEFGSESRTACVLWEGIGGYVGGSNGWRLPFALIFSNEVLLFGRIFGKST